MYIKMHPASTKNLKNMLKIFSSINPKKNLKIMITKINYKFKKNNVLRNSNPRNGNEPERLNY